MSSSEKSNVLFNLEGKKYNIKTPSDSPPPLFIPKTPSDSPPTLFIPKTPSASHNQYIAEAEKFVQKNYPENYGSVNKHHLFATILQS